MRPAFALLCWLVLASYANAAIMFSSYPVSTNEAVCKMACGGSGTLIGISADRRYAMVLTAAHVIVKGSNLYSGRYEEDLGCYFKNVPHLANAKFPGTLVKVDPRHDIAAILIPNPGVAPVVIGDLREAKPGIYRACGYGSGRYSVANGPAYYHDGAIIKTRVGIWPGHSGGALFDPNMCWVGLTNWNNGSNGPNPNGFTRARTGEPLERFIQEATYECRPRIFSRLFNRGGGGPNTCPPGGCPNPNMFPQTVPGAGYSQLAPGYQNITPGAAPAPQVVTTPGVTVATPGAQVAVAPAVAPAPAPAPAVVATDPYASPSQNNPAPAPDEPAPGPVPPPTTPPASASQIAQQPALEEPRRAIAAGGSLQELVEAYRQEEATRAAVRAYERAMLTERYERPQAAVVPMDVQGGLVDTRVDSELLDRLGAIEKKLGIETATADDPRAMIGRLPVVRMTVEYHDRTEKAEVNLASYIRDTFGLPNTEVDKAAK